MIAKDLYSFSVREGVSLSEGCNFYNFIVNISLFTEISVNSFSLLSETPLRSKNILLFKLS
jgi:hypothetical protein